MKDSLAENRSTSVAEQCSQAVEGALEGLWAWDVQNNRIYWSNWLYHLLGIPKQESAMTLETVLALTHPDDQHLLKELIPDSGLPNGGFLELECRMRQLDGTYRTLSLRGKAYADPNGAISRISGLVTDVTERRQTEEALQKAYKDLADLRHALDMSTIVAITDSHGVITYVNQAFCDISQYSAEELLGKTHRVINSGYHSKPFFQNMWRTIQAGLVWRDVIRNRAKDGSYYWVDTTIVPLLDEHGKAHQYIAIRHDITRQKNAEEEVRLSNQELEHRVQYRTTEVEQINLSLLQEIAGREQIEQELRQSLKREQLTRRLLASLNHSFDIDFILQMVAQEMGVFFGVDRCLVIHYENRGVDNRSLRVLAQYCRSEEIQQVPEIEIPWAQFDQLPGLTEPEHPQVLLNASSPEEFPATIQPYLETSGVQSILIVEIRYRNILFGRVSLHQCTSQRSWAPAEVLFLETLMPYIGSALYQAELHQEEQRAKQEAEEANRQKSKILSYVSHDFKNPLASMRRFIEILETDADSPLSTKQRELIGYISEGVQLLRNMVTNILDKARLEAGKMVPMLEWIDLSSLVEELRFIFQDLAIQRHIELTLDVQPGLPIIQADLTHLRQILINLLSNAVKYNQPHGKACLYLYKHQEEPYLVIEMRDTGKGISAEQIPNLFTDYYRADLSQANQIEGTGLGLAFIKKLVDLYGGDITVESEVGVGSTFKVLLPITADNEILPLTAQAAA